MNREEEYEITLTKSQLELLKVVCDNYGRIIIGQLEAGIGCRIDDAINRHETSHGRDYRSEVVKGALELIKKVAWDQGPSQSYGVGYSETSDELFDMTEVIRHQLWKDAGEVSRGTVDAYPPYHWNKKKPLIKIKKII